MNRVSAILVAALVLSPIATAEEPIRERIEWIDIWVTDADKDELPRVLLVGDSIARGYFAGVEQHLKGKAYCARLTTSKCVSDPSFNADLELLLKQYSFAVIHFNNGLHGWGYSEAQYQDGLKGAVGAIKAHAPEAQLIWATTTPVRESSNLQQFSDRTGRVQARNQIAAEVMDAHGVSTNDLFELVEQHPDWHANDGVHFNERGREAQAEKVAESVDALLTIKGSSAADD